MTALAVLLATEAEERELPLPAEVYGGVALVVLLLLLAITMSFNRDR